MTRRKFGPEPFPYHDHVTELPAMTQAVAISARATVHTLLPLMIAVVDEIAELNNSLRTGGYFFMSWLGSGPGPRIAKAVLHLPVGIIPVDKANDWYRLSREKANRLAKNLRKGHVSSWQSRDGRVRYGGAIATKKYLFSFSGLPELADEAFMLWLAVYLRVLTLRKAQAIAAISDNPYFNRISFLTQQ